ncbi:RxLR effector protein [Phytophthora megakarya]|uniref:RxLR effector protein n=1 Tax=Phytophthora megakarya TaxID=4795 RepID=A0A225W864_9STRA|nr:RxLR effector protein [Phytophthora megakarya]
MRVTYTIVSVVVATLFASSAAFPVTKDSTGMVDKVASAGIVDSIYMHDKRLLRRVEKANVGDDEMGEERGPGDFVSKLNPIKAAKKAAEKVAHAAKIHKFRTAETKHAQWLEQMREKITKE